MAVHTWKWAIMTPQGIYTGELIGEIEPGETDEQAMQTVSDTVKEFLQSEQRANILACIVSDKALHIDAPGTELITLDIEKEFPHNQ